MGRVTPPEPWERQQEETSKQYEAFCIYRDMGTERSLSKVSEKLQKSDTLIGRWSRMNDWVERTAQWDNEQDRIKREAEQKQQIEDIKKMRKRHAGMAQSMLLKAALALQAIPPEDIKPSDISRMVDVASKLERISRGDVETVIEERNGGDAISPVQIYIPDNGRDGKGDNFDDLEV